MKNLPLIPASFLFHGTGCDTDRAWYSELVLLSVTRDSLNNFLFSFANNSKF